MSVTFHATDCPRIPSCCDTCDGDGWDFNADRSGAGPFGPIPEGSRCWSCDGTGVEAEPVLVPVNLANANAYAVLRALGLSVGDCYGDLTRSDVARLLLVLDNTDRDLDGLTREGGDLTRFAAVERDGIARIEQQGPRVHVRPSTARASTTGATAWSASCDRRSRSAPGSTGIDNRPTGQEEAMATDRREPLGFTVEGTGAFPFDMLRYDQCWPASEDRRGSYGLKPDESTLASDWTKPVRSTC